MHLCFSVYQPDIKINSCLLTYQRTHRILIALDSKLQTQNILNFLIIQIKVIYKKNVHLIQCTKGACWRCTTHLSAHWNDELVKLVVISGNQQLSYKKKHFEIRASVLDLSDEVRLVMLAVLSACFFSVRQLQVRAGRGVDHQCLLCSRQQLTTRIVSVHFTTTEDRANYVIQNNYTRRTNRLKQNTSFYLGGLICFCKQINITYFIEMGFCTYTYKMFFALTYEPSATITTRSQHKLVTLYIIYIHVTKPSTVSLQ